MPSDRTRGSLEVRELSKSFGSRSVLDRISFSLAPGSFTCLSGGNGTGKSTLVRCLSGLTSFSGSARLDGVRLPDGTRARRWLGYVPQDPAFADTATVAETLRFFSRLRGVQPRVDTLPSDFLPPSHSRLGVLSGGQRQRLALAIGLLGRPRLLLLDEPVANLDDDARVATWSALERLRERGMTIVVVTPAPGELRRIADRVLLLNQGTLVSYTTPEHFPPSDPTAILTARGAYGAATC